MRLHPLHHQKPFRAQSVRLGLFVGCATGENVEANGAGVADNGSGFGKRLFLGQSGQQSEFLWRKANCEDSAGVGELEFGLMF